MEIACLFLDSGDDFKYNETEDFTLTEPNNFSSINTHNYSQK